MNNKKISSHIRKIKNYANKMKIIFSLVLLLACVSVFAFANNIGDVQMTDVLKDDLKNILNKTTIKGKISIHKIKPTAIDNRRFFGTVNIARRVLGLNDASSATESKKYAFEESMPPIVNRN